MNGNVSTSGKYKSRRSTNHLSKMSRRRVREILSELKRLSRLSKKDRRTCPKTCDGPVVNCMCECIRNLLCGRIPLKSRLLNAIHRYKRLLGKAALKKTSRSERRRLLQKGGFLGAVFPALVSGIASLASPALGYLFSNYAAEC